MLVDVLHDPHIAVGSVHRIDGAAVQAGPEQRTILAPHLNLGGVGLALRQLRTSLLTQLDEVRLAGIDDGAGGAFQFVTAVAQHLGTADITFEDNAVLAEQDAHRRIFKNGTLFQQRFAQRALVALGFGDVVEDDGHAIETGGRRQSQTRPAPTGTGHPRT